MTCNVTIVMAGRSMEMGEGKVRGTSTRLVARGLAERLACKAKKRLSSVNALGEIRVLSVDGVGSVKIHVFDDKSVGEVAEQISRSLLKGESVLVGGFVYWIDVSPILGDDSGGYVWNSDSNRVRHNIYLCMKLNERVRRVVVGRCWQVPE